jgi:sialate O-acetylesterase
VAYYFGLDLHQNLGIPVGLIEAAWGGTAIEPWTPPDAFAMVPETTAIMAELRQRIEDYRSRLTELLPQWEAWVRESRKAISGNSELPSRPDFPAHPLDDPQSPTTLYNGMIHPLIGFAIRGAIWYQGESNRNDCLAYEHKMEALIRGWREVWNLGDFPFYYVQLAPYEYAYNREDPGGDVPDFFRLPLIWEAQMRILRLPATGMAVTTDITDLNDIHPRNKKDVGIRLALWARAGIYGEANLCPSGPLFRSMSIEADRARIFFDYAAGGLISNDGQPLRWFEIAAEDHIFHKAVAEVDGETVVVSSPRVTAPKAVRFGWHQSAVPNLANRQGLPASPFRTDAW